MGSIRLVYDSEGDILDVDFRLTGEKPRRGIELHDNITVWTNAQGTRILRLMFLSYSRLLEQPDLPLVKLKKAPGATTGRLAEAFDQRSGKAVSRMHKPKGTTLPGRRPWRQSRSGGVKKKQVA